LDQDIFGDMRLTVKDIEKYTLLLNEEGSQHLQSLAQNASYVVAEFLKNLIGLHGRLELTELAKKVVEDPDLVLDAEPNQWDSTQIDIKTRDFKLLLAVLMYANTDEREERRLRRTAQRLFQASQKANRQIAIRTLDSIGFFDSGCDSNPDSGYRFSSGSLKIEDAAPPSYRLNDYVPPLLEKCSGNAVKIQKWLVEPLSLLGWN
jgi:hypothetical protein